MKPEELNARISKAVRAVIHQAEENAAGVNVYGVICDTSELDNGVKYRIIIEASVTFKSKEADA